jgi:hypothetical protein
MLYRSRHRFEEGGTIHLALSARENTRSSSTKAEQTLLRQSFVAARGDTQAIDGTAAQARGKVGGAKWGLCSALAERTVEDILASLTTGARERASRIQKVGRP